MTVGRIPSVEGGIQPTILTTTGDILYASSASNPARLAIGSSAQVLTVASGIPSWATPASAIPSFSLVATLTLAGNASYTATGLSSYNQLYCTLNAVSADATNLITYTFNSDTGNNYSYQNTDMYQNGNSFATANVFMSNSSSSSTSTQYIGSQGATDGDYTEGYIHYFGTKSTGPKMGHQWFSWNGGTHSNYNGPVQYLGTSAISSMTFTSSGALDGGTIKIYGSAV